MTAFQQYIDLDRILQEQNDVMMAEIVALMQKNISIGYVSKLVSKHTNVEWRLIPAHEIAEYLRREGLIADNYNYYGRDDTQGCLIFMPSGYLAGSVTPGSIIDGPPTASDEK